MKVVLVEDSGPVRDALSAALRGAGYRVTPVGTGAAALEAVTGPDAAADPPDIVLLDLGLPDLDGVEVCRRLRTRSTVPIIAVTARGHQQARVLGLRSGADDYVVKPFAIDELTARMEAVLRRSAGHVVAPVVHAGPLRIDLSRRVVEVSGREVGLRRKEFDLLAALARRDGAVVSRADLLDDVWGLAPDDPGLDAGLHSLEVHVAALRSKLDTPGAVVTVRGVGYRLAAGD
ncbi:DNA-binding response regulator [Actinomycetospora sp. NBRC 106375]|uniref:response regulator transcription factor n=1 Tax=Actinomycetospora sp. NBRC 106375 TaxID=3032207 RepID=UPI0024A282BD|nr:response regulator transcription factor [Actinomycetospora sp. NBRC 106375]GLZ49970.1 DNA-binding response regulator [Actinomycetospora sp. NBRC 106375]